jgi:hypothetical protein
MVFDIVEPTLNSYTGHCFSLVEAIAEAAPVEHVRVWAGKNSGKFWKSKGEIRPYFSRTLRKIQSYLLYKRLLAEPGKILLSTAGTTDFVLLNWAAKGQIPPGKVYLYVHWLGNKAAKAKLLSATARRQPFLEILCTTATTTAFFKELGFRATTVAYPHVMDVPVSQPSSSFKHLLFAGAARLDKGFDRMVDLVEDLALSNASWPVWIQASATHQAQHGAAVLFQIDRLKRANYANLTLLGETLSPTDYRALFDGGISVQPYSEVDFQDRVSGVTLDALTAGCPVVVTAHTWLGRVVLEHNAGLAISDLSPRGLQQAVHEILLDYEAFSRRAFQAGQILQNKHSTVAMIQAVFHKERLRGV